MCGPSGHDTAHGQQAYTITYILYILFVLLLLQGYQFTPSFLYFSCFSSSFLLLTLSLFFYKAE